MGGLSELSKFLDTFPPDIKEAAWSEVNGSLGYIDSTEGAVAVARAILAERQRCAYMHALDNKPTIRAWRAIVDGVSSEK
ncbi:hypothetical protein GOB40_14065 [Sinorhizobium meliloti]|nr:hypothetical protein [Sinorhizobium meliloti]